MKPKEGRPQRTLLSGFAMPGTAFVVLLLFGGAAALGFYLWGKYGAAATSGDNYVLTVDDIEMPPQPAWIRASVKEAVLHDGAIGNLEIRDPQLTVRVAQAFELHPWVAEVTRVSKKYPAGVVIELTYRRPAAMVEVNLNNQPGLLPVDAQGILLPPDDFSANDTRAFLRIAAGETGPAGTIGSPWGDERIAGAAAIAGLLKDVWQPAGLYRIVASTITPGEKRPPSFDIVTRNGYKVAWGATPGKESSAESKAAEKLARFSKFVEQYGAIESSGLRELDLRDPNAVVIPARTAARPGVEK